jgi:hypothetical protein
MTVKLDLNPDIEAGLTALAQAQGLSLQAYLERMLRNRVAATAPHVTSGNVAKAGAFEAFARAHRPVGSLSDELLRRENLVRETR